MSVQMRTMLDVADNSGARKLQVILPLGGGLGKKAGLGDVVTAAVKAWAADWRSAVRALPRGWNQKVGEYHGWLWTRASCWRSGLRAASGTPSRSSLVRTTFRLWASR